METLDINKILENYLICALWTDEEQIKEKNENVDITIGNVSEDSKNKALSDIKKFVKVAGKALKGLTMEEIGHNLWLTRNGHGTGFWDRGYVEKVSDKLTKCAKELGSLDIYVGDDEKLHFS
jgi:hypothetical protein